MARREVGVADTGGVTVAVRRQPADDDEGDFRAGERAFEERGMPTDDVGIHSRAGNVLAHFVDDQQVDGIEGQLGHPRLGLAQQFSFARLDVRRREGADECGLVVAVLDDAESEGDSGALHHFSAERGDHGFVTQLDVGPVRLHGAAMLAHADGHHLEHPRADLPRKSRMGLDPVDHADPVRLGSVAVQPNGEAEHLANLYHFHGGFDGAAHCPFGNPVMRQNSGLPLSCTAAMATHGGYDERLRPQ